MNKKVFISYSWGNKEHQEWVVNLGKRLMSNTVLTILDKWSLKDGHDIHEFMESMVKSDDIYRVLIICDKNYKEKADGRNGGVGTETQIITPEIYNNQKQEKFIPIVVERDENNNPYLPIFLSSRKYIDFSNEEFFEDSYEELLRNILEAPAIPMPKLGTNVPLYITESVINNTPTNSIIRTLENQIKKHPEKINSYSSDFLDAFLDALWEFEFKSNAYDIDTFGEELFNNLISYKILREDFIQFLNITTKPENNLDVDELINFFEKKLIYNRPKDESTSWNSNNYDNFKVIFQELFLYTITICLKNKNYSLVGDLFHSKYYFKSNYGQIETKRFTEIYEYHQNIENYILRKYNRSSGFGHFVITNLSDKVSKNDFIFADTLCHYIGELFSNGHSLDNWFPATYVYKETGNNDFFEKMSSERHFNKVKNIFDVSSIEELKKLLKDYSESKNGKNRTGYGRGYYIPFIHELIQVESIGQNR
ncbi:SEFIR domain-containing protein [Flavobacterium cauense R2A-7]|nr:toll/interleukin-1 receptor domain-containing protein [Flavobacterium cauense]ESU19937.1 SEFIR domain-containing protein [Flavobacterium cauense R2A-7]